MRKNIVILMVMLLVVGCTDHDEEIGVVPDSQNGSELLIEETSGLQFQPEDFVSNLYNGMMTDGKDVDYTPVATTVLKMVGKVMTNAFGNFISQQTPALDKLFESFQQVDSKRNRSVEGTGLGLFISKRLVDLMNGHIDVESVKGEGTTFTVTITLGISGRKDRRAAAFSSERVRPRSRLSSTSPSGLIL